MLTNLLEETLHTLAIFGKDESEIVEVIDGDNSCSWEEFKTEAHNINYDAGYGPVEINMCLRIISRHWWLERVEYDGREEWDLRQMPFLPTVLSIPYA